MYVILLLMVSISQWSGMYVLRLLMACMSQQCGMQEHPAFMVFSKGEQGGAALVRSILNRAVGAPPDSVKQVRHHTHLQEDKQR